MAIGLKRRKKGQANSAGFTLVELMVVVSIASLLFALMFPALATAKEKSRRAVCKSDLRQISTVLVDYALDSYDLLPSCADNKDFYHSIILSDATFTNLVSMAEGNSNIFYCPNIVFGRGPNAVSQHNQFGYVIGYSFLEGYIAASSNNPEATVEQVKLSSLYGTNELMADANYWTTASSGYFPTQMKIAPHTVTGAAMFQSSSFTVGLPGGSSVSLGAVGGNVLFADWHVEWRSLPRMQTNAASQNSDSQGLW